MKKLLVIGILVLIVISLASPVQAGLLSDVFDFLFSTQSEQPTIIKISHATQNVSFGEAFSIDIIIEPHTSIAGAQFNLQVNPSLVKINSVTEGNLFSQNGANTIFSPGIIDNNVGIVRYIWGNPLGAGEGVSSAGTFATINLTAIAQGASQLNLITVGAISVKISDSDGNPVPIEIENGTVNIGAITIYGNGWKEIHHLDGSVSHTEGVRTFQRWDGVWRPHTEWNTSYTNISGELIADGGSFKSIFYQHKNTIITDKFRFSQQPSALHFLNIETKAHTEILDASAASQITLQNNKLIYEDIYPNVDYEFTYNGVKLKEDIVSHRTNYPASPYPLDKTYLVFSTKLWEFSGIRKLIDDDGEIAGNKDIKGILKLKNINEDVLSYLPIGYASSVFVNQTCYNETNGVSYICNQTKTTKVHNRLIKVSGTWYLFSGINYAWVKDVNRIGDITIDPTWVVGSGGNAWSGNVSHDDTTEVQSTGDVELRQEVDDYVSHWRMDKGTGNAAFDENETNNNDGDFTDGSTGNWTSSSKYGDYALDFDGTDDYVDCGSKSSLNITQHITVCAWINKTSNTAYAGIVEKGTGNQWGYLLREYSGGEIQFGVLAGGGKSAISSVVNTGEWCFICGRYNKQNVSIFIDGIETVGDAETGDITLPDLSVNIGWDAYSAARCFSGTIDDARIYNRALSNDEINQTMDNEHYTSGNLTSWYDAGSGNETYKLSVNFTFPANTNASINLYNNDTGTFIETLATNNNTEQWSKIITSPVQDSKVNITLYGNVTETPEICNITYHTQTVVGAPVITLLSQTPSTIYQNSTGSLNISYGITHDSVGLNNTSVSFIYRNYDHDLSDSNHSIRPPSNNKSAVWNYNGKILRGANRNETLNFENNDTITGGDIYTWSGLDENNTRLTIVPVNSTYTKVYINGTIHDLMPQMWYLDRSDLQEAPKTQIGIHKHQNVLIKFWSFEVFKGNYDFIGVGYTDTGLDANPSLHPSDATPLEFYYVNSSYDPTTGGDPVTSGYAVYMGSLNASGWLDHVYKPHTNSSYVRGFINNRLLHSYITTTEISYLYFTSNTPSSKPYYINVTNVANPTNVSFADTNVLWMGDTAPYTAQAYTPNIWFSFMKNNMSFDHKIYVADNNNQWANSTLNSTVIGKALFPPTKPTFYNFHNGFTDYDMNGTYSGTFDIGVNVATDPDGGTVTHNLTLNYANGTFVAIINNTFTDADVGLGVPYTNISFNPAPYYSATETYTMKVVATDDEAETSESWLGVNFSLNPPTLTTGNIQNIKEDWGQDFSSNFSANVTGQNAKDVWVNFTHNNFTNTSLGWVNISVDEWVNESHNVNSPITNISVTIYLNTSTADATNDTDTFYYEITKRTNTATMDSATTQTACINEDFYIDATCNEEYADTFYGAADLLEDEVIVLTNASVVDSVNFIWNKSTVGIYNYTVRFYNLTHYDNVTTPTYSNVTIITGYTPPDATNIQNTTGNFWVNHTWQVGAGNITDSYNVSINLTGYNGTTNTHYNNSGLSTHGWSNASVLAYNTSCNGTLSTGSISDNVQIPNNFVVISNCSNRSAIETQTVYVDIDSTDADGDTPTFSSNRTDLFTDFNTSTGQGNWSTTTLDNGTYYIDFGVSDGYGSTDNCTMTITIAEGTPTAPTNLQYSLSNVNQTIEWTWTNGQNTDSIDAILNGSAIGTITSPYQYTNSTLPRWENLSIRGYNTTTSEYSIWANDTVYIADGPDITSWWNNYTTDNSTNFTIPHEDEDNRTVFFNVTADQSIDYWIWYVDGTLYQNSSSDNITKSWDEGGNKIVGVHGINANGQTSTLTWDIEIEYTQYEYAKLIYEQNQLLLEEEKMMGLSLLISILVIVGVVFFLLGILVPHSVLTLLGSMTFFITMALPIPVLTNYAYFGIALTSILLLFGLVGVIVTFYQWFTTYNSDKGYHKWDDYFNNQNQ